MSTSFRIGYTVIKRDIGQIINGRYVLASDTGVTISIMASVQNPSIRDMQKIETTEYGRRAGRYVKIYTETRLRCANQEISPGRERYAGDILLFDGSQYLLFGEANFNTLKKTRTTKVSHFRYYACETIEQMELENAP